MEKRRNCGSLWFWIILIFTLATAVAILSFSAESGKESAETSGRVTDVLLSLVSPQYRSLPEEAQKEVQAKYAHAVRKTAHFTEFAAFGFFLSCFILSIKWEKKKITPSIWVLLAFFGGVAFACFDEWHQRFSIGRGPSWYDVLIDSLGVLFGVAAAWLSITLYRKKRRAGKT